MESKSASKETIASLIQNTGKAIEELYIALNTYSGACSVS